MRLIFRSNLTFLSCALAGFPIRNTGIPRLYPQMKESKQRICDWRMVTGKANLVDHTL